MARYTLQLAERYLRRTFEKAVGKSLIKIIAELTTNSDDSYRRLQVSDPLSAKREGFGTIRIIALRKTRRFAVVDQAEGLTQEEMKINFVEYGQESGDQARGYRTRSLFGKGLRDVLFTQKYGFVKSIKDRRASISDFGWRKRKGGSQREPTITIHSGPKVNSAFRQAQGIPGNGTRVEFQLRKDIPFPQHDVLAAKLQYFYMLRMINGDPNRMVILQTVGSRGEVLETPINFNPLDGESLVDTNLTLRIDETDLPVRLSIQRSDLELTQGETGMEDRVGGLLILDEDSNALDLTLLKFDRDPAARRLFGIVRIEGAGAYIRKKLNSDPPEEVLTETRDGLDRKHRFYAKIAGLVEPFLDEIIEREVRKKKRPEDAFTSETQERIVQAMDRLNKLFEDLVGKADLGDEFKGTKPFIPPILAFVRNKLSITENVATPLALLVNSDVVGDGTLIRLSSSSDDVMIRPSELLVRREEANDGLFVKITHLVGTRVGASAKVLAEIAQGEARAEVTVIPEAILYPLAGLEFAPSSMKLRDGAKRNLHLYIDSEKVKPGSKIGFEVDSDSFEVTPTKIEFGEHHRITDEVGRLTIHVVGRGIGSRGVVEASHGSLRAQANLRVVRKEKRKAPPERGRRFKEPVFERIGLSVPAIMRPDGTIVINMKDKVNERYFGEQPYVSVEESPHAQVRLADLVLDECLNEIVTTAYGRSLPVRFPNEPATDIRMHVAQLKFEIGPDFHSTFVTLDRPTISNEGTDPEF